MFVQRAIYTWSPGKILVHAIACRLLLSPFCPSLCPSIRLSVTLGIDAYMIQYIEMCPTPHDRVMFLVF